MPLFGGNHEMLLASGSMTVWLSGGGGEPDSELSSRMGTQPTETLRHFSKHGLKLRASQPLPKD
jgi:hypothetical protein